MPEWLQWALAIIGSGSTTKLVLDWLIFRDKLTAGTIDRMWKEIDDLKKQVKILGEDRTRLVAENGGLRLENAGLRIEVNDLCRRMDMPDRYKVQLVIKPTEPTPPRITGA